MKITCPLSTTYESLGANVHGYVVYSKGSLEVRARTEMLGAAENRVLTVLIADIVVATLHQMAELGDAKKWPAHVEVSGSIERKELIDLLVSQGLVDNIESFSIETPALPGDDREKVQQEITGVRIGSQDFQHITVGQISETEVVEVLVSDLPINGTNVSGVLKVDIKDKSVVSIEADVQGVDVDPNLLALALAWSGRFKIFPRMGVLVCQTVPTE